VLGRQRLAKRTNTGFTEAERYFRKAIELDPNFAPARQRSVATGRSGSVLTADRLLSGASSGSFPGAIGKQTFA
jgi:hypothetical protein